MKDIALRPSSTPRSHRPTLLGWLLLAVMVVASTGGAAEPAPSLPGKPASGPKVGPSTFTREMPLGRAIEILRHSTDKPLNIVVYWKEIGDNAGVYRDTPIGFDGIEGLSIRQHLEVLLGSISATSDTPLGYTVQKGVVIIATLDRLPKSRPVTRVYDVSDLVAPPSGAFGPGRMGGFGHNMGLGGFGRYGAAGGPAPVNRSPRRRGGRR